MAPSKRKSGGMEPDNIDKLESTRLVSYTDNFSESNYIGRFQFGKLYRGSALGIPKRRFFVVKIWEVPEIYNYEAEDNKYRMMEEMVLLRHEALINHPGMVKLFGYCHNREHLAAVYEFKINPYDSVFNLIPKDDFTWLQRIKTAFGLASLLKFLHASMLFKPFVVQNLDAAHIVLDADYNPKLCDFGLIRGGIIQPRREGRHVLGCYGYIDVDASSIADCSSKQDVFAYGVILLSLISKRVYTEEDRQAGVPPVYEWALREYDQASDQSESAMKNGDSFSLVHKSMEADCDFSPADGHTITMLAMKCVDRVHHKRPTMKHVFRSLLKLEVVKQHADFVGANKRPCENHS